MGNHYGTSAASITKSPNLGLPPKLQARGIIEYKKWSSKFANNFFHHVSQEYLLIFPLLARRPGSQHGPLEDCGCQDRRPLEWLLFFPTAAVVVFGSEKWMFLRHPKWKHWWVAGVIFDLIRLVFPCRTWIAWLFGTRHPGKAMGSLNWFAVHPTSMNSHLARKDQRYTDRIGDHGCWR